MDSKPIRTTVLGEGECVRHFEIRGHDEAELEDYRQAVMAAVMARKKVREPAPCRGCGKD